MLKVDEPGRGWLSYFGIVISMLLLLLSIVGLVSFFMTLPEYFSTGSGDGMPYALSFLLLIYSLYLIVKLFKGKDYADNHKFTLHLLIWPVILSVLLMILFIILSFISGEGLGIFFGIILCLLGLTLSVVLSLIGLAIDAVRNK